MLPEDYYCRNFLALTRFVYERCDDILNDAEQAWFAAVDSLPTDAIRLYVRLLCRRGSVFRVSRLRYAEIESIDRALDRLVETGLADRSAPSLAALLPLLRRAELLSLAGLAPGDRTRRDELEAGLLDGRDPSLDRRAAEHDRWITQLGRTHFATFSLCYFGNPWQDISEFVCRDLGHSRWPEYRVDRAARAFPDRTTLDAHLALVQREVELSAVAPDDAAALVALAEALPAASADDHALQRRRGRLLDTIGRQLERLGALDEARAVYEHSPRPPARERLVRLLYRTGDVRRALDVIDDMLVGEVDDAERQFAETWHRRLALACGRRPPPQNRFRPAVTRLVLVESGLRVEEASRRYFARRGDCHYTENALVTGVLGLFIWDILYSAVPGAFYNPFQSAPADYHGRDFRRARSSALDERLRETADAARMRARVLSNHSRWQGCQNPLVRWGRLTPGLIERSLERIPGPHWRVMFERLLDDPKTNASGWPDLVSFPADGGYELIEIKGPGDALQRHQRRWMQYFQRHRIPYRCVQVRWTAARGLPAPLAGAAETTGTPSVA